MADTPTSASGSLSPSSSAGSSVTGTRSGEEDEAADEFLDEAGAVGVVKESNLQSTVLASCRSRRKKKANTLCFNQSLEEVESFALSSDQLLLSLKAVAKSLGFAISVCDTRTNSRLWFGLPKKIRKIIESETLSGKINTTLFRFNERKDGLFHSSETNSAGLECYVRYRAIYGDWLKKQGGSDTAVTPRTSMSDVRRDPKIWTDDDETTLIAMRAADNPSTFKQIALALNRTHEVIGSLIDRPFEDQDCRNKWRRMFPSSMDANKTLEYLKALKRMWPGLVYKTQTEKCKDNTRAPTLIGLHVVWPWTKELMRVMSPSLFCDATYKVTLYKYKVVAITTLDGNKHHRPLMVSFILKSNGKTWRLIFDMFYR